MVTLMSIRPEVLAGTLRNISSITRDRNTGHRRVWLNGRSAVRFWASRSTILYAAVLQDLSALLCRLATRYCRRDRVPSAYKVSQDTSGMCWRLRSDLPCYGYYSNLEEVVKDFRQTTGESLGWVTNLKPRLYSWADLLLD